MNELKAMVTLVLPEQRSSSHRICFEQNSVKSSKVEDLLVRCLAQKLHISEANVRLHILEEIFVDAQCLDPDLKAFYDVNLDDAVVHKQFYQLRVSRYNESAKIYGIDHLPRLDDAAEDNCCDFTNRNESDKARVSLEPRNQPRVIDNDVLDRREDLIHFNEINKMPEVSQLCVVDEPMDDDCDNFMNQSGSEKTCHVNQICPIDAGFQDDYEDDFLQKEINISDLDRLTRRSLGKLAVVGALYDSKRDQFLTNDAEVSNINVPILCERSTEMECVVNGIDIDNRCDLLHLNVEERASVISELSPVCGYGEFLLDLEMFRQKGVCFSFAIVLSRLTKIVQIELDSHDVVAEILSNRNFGDATHVVARVAYGTVVAAVFSSMQQISDYETLIEKIRRICSDERLDPSTLKAYESFVSVKLYANDLHGVSRITTLCDGIKILQNFSQNTQKEHPVYYGMVPLRKLINEKHLTIANSYVFRESDLKSKQELITLLRKTRFFTINMSEFIDACKKYDYCLDYNESAATSAFINEFNAFYNFVISECQKYILEMRSSTDKERFITYENLSKSYSQKNWRLQNFIEKCLSMMYKLNQGRSTLSKLDKKFSFAKHVDDKGVFFIKDVESLKISLDEFKKRHEKCFVCFKHSDDQTMDDTFLLFNKLIESQNNCVYYVFMKNETTASAPPNHVNIDSELNMNKFKISNVSDLLKIDGYFESGNETLEPYFLNVNESKSKEVARNTEDVGWKNVKIFKQTTEQINNKDTIENSAVNELTELVAQIATKTSDGGSHLIKFDEFGELSLLDVYADYVRKLRLNIAKSSKYEVDARMPFNAIHLEISCPNSKFCNGSCTDKECVWLCDECEQNLMFYREHSPSSQSLSDYFYCKCGRALVETFAFRCDDFINHGDVFISFKSNFLRHFLDQILSFGEKNILVLGETGVGKSTWINGIANYMTYTSLDDAVAADELNCLIPSKFVISDEDFNERTIYVCNTTSNLLASIDAVKDDAECLDVGKSHTTQPRPHVIPFKGGNLRIIDTPGIGDTDGPEQDKKNFKNILQYISTIKEIHGICILLKPNDSRLTIVFKYCINELLTHLHKDAAKNIIFCFTNTSGLRYRPGDTLPQLKKLLADLKKEEGVDISITPANTFCMDNESFRFLCEVKNGVKYTKEEYEKYAESWVKSATETSRLIKYVLSLEPHRANETVSLNEARRIILTLSQPLAKISQNIQANIVAVNDEEKRLATLDTRDADFQTKLMYKVIYIAAKELPYPRTVCTDQGCTESKKDGRGVVQIYYKTHCHEHCYLEGVALETKPNTLLQNCCAMTNISAGIKCRICDCLWSTHIHLRYEQYEKEVMEEDKQVRQLINENMDNKVSLETRIRNNKENRIQYENEQKRINYIAARFGSYLKQNAIKCHNDAIREYILMTIDDQKRIAEVTKDNRRVLGLQNSLLEYEEQKRIIESCIKNQGELIEAGDIKRLCQELFALPLSGENIRELFVLEEKSQREQAKFTENHFSQRYKQRSARNKQVNSCGGVGRAGGALTIYQNKFQTQSKNYSNLLTSTTDTTLDHYKYGVGGEMPKRSDSTWRNFFSGNTKKGNENYCSENRVVSILPTTSSSLKNRLFWNLFLN